MRYLKPKLKRTILTILLIIGIIAAFLGFLRGNSDRIARQNEEYLIELTSQRAISIDSMISENLTFIHSTAYLYGKSLTSPQADVAVIREFEENAVFDYLRFIDADGDDYTSQGMMANLSDRDYFQAGMRGETGTTYVTNSRVTGEKQIGFYTPVYYEDEVIGVMVGFYGEAFIQRLLEYELFGYQGEGWLCTRDGTVLGSTLTEAPDNLFTHMRDEHQLSPSEAQRLSDAFHAGENLSFTFTENGETARGYAVALTQADWVLIRNFPPDASGQILKNADLTGEWLILELVALFVIFVVVLLLDAIAEQKRVREANRNANDVSTGVSLLFDHFIALELDTNEYRYVGGEPSQAGIPPQGDFAVLYDTILSCIADPQERSETAQMLDMDRLRALLTEADRVSFRVHAEVGETEWFTFNFIVLSREGANPRRLLLVCQDVTDLHRQEEEEQRQLKDALDAAERASRAKTEFLFNMSHDLRTPMNAIIGYTELAQQDDVSRETMLGYIRKIDSSSAHLLALINDILEMSRIESGKLTLEPVRTDLIQTMDECRELFATQMTGKRLTFTVDTSGVTDRWVLCDKNRLNRILLNLLSNACKFTPEGGAVTATLRQTGAEEGEGRYELRVKDNGIGMSPEFAAKLFTPFERERTSTVSGIQGTGLGLSITRSIVDLMGGSIDVATEQGAGTEFIVRLRFPLTEGAEETQREAPSAPAVDFSRVRLLLVEDNLINREIASMLLTQAGFQLETAENGQIAVDLVSASEGGYYDIILMDIQMPVMDGYAAARAIRALDDPALAGIPILAMTANAFQEDVQAARDAGMNGHIAKPLDVDRMFATITATLAARDN